VEPTLINDHLSHFGGLPVQEYREGSGLPNAGERAWRIGLNYDETQEGEEVFDERLRALLAEPSAEKIEAVVIGMWGEVGIDGTPDHAVQGLINGRGRLKSLKRLFFGDIVGEEAEISWINQTAMTPLLDAFPRLEEFGVRGAVGHNGRLSFENLRHDSLRSLTVQSGGLPSAVVQQIASAELPSLERLELWLGVDNYGGDYALDDFGPIFQAENFPKLRHLGLRDSDQADAIARAIAEAPVLDQLESLDLSMGTLGDEGAKALLASPKVKKLKRLNLRHHYMSREMMAELQKQLPGVEVNVEGRREEEVYEYNGTTYRERYCEVTE
jgi:hypothetical protein